MASICTAGTLAHGPHELSFHRPIDPASVVKAFTLPSSNKISPKVMFTTVPAAPFIPDTDSHPAISRGKDTTYSPARPRSCLTEEGWNFRITLIGGANCSLRTSLLGGFASPPTVASTAGGQFAAAPKSGVLQPRTCEAIELSCSSPRYTLFFTICPPPTTQFPLTASVATHRRAGSSG